MPHLVHRNGVHMQTPATSTEPREKRMRLTDVEFEEVLGEFQQWRAACAHNAQPPRGMPKLASSRRRLELFLVYLSRGGFFGQVGFAEGAATSTACTYCHEVAEFFSAISRFYIWLPTTAELPALGVPLLGRTAVLFIDGLIQPIQRPAHVGDAYYCGRNGKACDALNIQIVSDRNGLIRHIVTGVPGSAHDLVAIRQSPWFMRYVAQLPMPYAVVGDVAYMGQGPQWLTPHRQPPRGQLTQQQTQENHEIS